MARRIEELGTTVPKVALRAGIDPTTLRRFITGRSWPRPATRDRLCAALDWPEGEIGRRAISGDRHLERVPTDELAGELAKRHGWEVDGRKTPDRAFKRRHAEAG